MRSINARTTQPSSYAISSTGLKQVSLGRRAHRPTQLQAASSVVTTAPAQEIKQHLAEQLKGLDRGIFGVAASQKASLHALIADLESQNQVAAPIDNLSLVEGDWRLLYSTIKITGVKRTKLGLREFVRLGDFIQSIDTAQSLAVNKVDFSVAGLGLIRGSLTIKAGYKRAGPQRVDIEFLESLLVSRALLWNVTSHFVDQYRLPKVPKELQKLFEANYDLLLSIFNPQGYLDVTYLDSTHRVGRDDKGNIFYLEKI